MVPESLYRWTLLAVVACGLAISVRYRRRADRAGGRVARRGDGALVLAGLTVSGLCGVGGLVVYLLNPAWMRWSQMELPGALRLLGAPLGVLAVGLLWWVHRHLGSNVTPTAQTRVSHTLITSGPYRWVRHPMYASGLVFFASYFLLTASWFIGAACGLVFVVLAARTGREERNLIERFGEAYRSYAARTGRFLPRRCRPGARNGRSRGL